MPSRNATSLQKRNRTSLNLWEPKPKWRKAGGFVQRLNFRADMQIRPYRFHKLYGASGCGCAERYFREGMLASPYGLRKFLFFIRCLASARTGSAGAQTAHRCWRRAIRSSSHSWSRRRVSCGWYRKVSVPT